MKLASSDLTPLDFCLWGWMKSDVYKEKVNARDELAARIMNSAALLKQERQDDLRRAVAPCCGTGEHINMNKVIYSLMNAGQS